MTGFRIFKASWVLFASKYSKTSQKELFSQKSSFCLVFGLLKLAGWFGVRGWLLQFKPLKTTRLISEVHAGWLVCIPIVTGGKQVLLEATRNRTAAKFEYFSLVLLRLKAELFLPTEKVPFDWFSDF